MAGVLISQFKNLPIPAANLAGQTIIVLGANTGLGKEAARHFVQRGASTVILGVRTPSKGVAAKEDIESTTKRLGVIEVWEIDYSSYASVKAFAKRCEGVKRIDAVVANASIATRDFKLAEGSESTITVNVISTFLLVLLLLPTLRASASKWGTHPTITVVSSGVHAWPKFQEWKSDHILDTLSDPKTANMKER
jgi:retinol dehydrogenase-12